MSEVWTLDALKKHFDARFNALREAVDKRDAYFEKRMDGSNEWRGALQDLSTKQASKESVDALTDRVKKLEDTDLKGDSKAAGISQLGAMVAQAVATAVAVVGGIQLLR